ncbi:MAG: formylglycine-generating enzyme family protein [Syntrophomonadaceae bacterium]
MSAANVIKKNILSRAKLFAAASVLLISANILPAKENKEQFSAAKTSMVLVKGGKYTPFWKDNKSIVPVRVKPFYLDAFQVTNGDFLKFVKANPKWQRSKAKNIFAGGNYLRHWKSDLELGSNADANSPVTNVSWFAARAFAQWKGKRLPSIAEWEFAALSGSKTGNQLNEKKLNQKILEWYLTPKPERPAHVGLGKHDHNGVHDLHGLVFEWVDDFNGIMAGGLGGDGDESNLFCGSGVVNSSDPANYAAFLRFAFRNGLKANYAVYDLGFRCAKDAN